MTWKVLWPERPQKARPASPSARFFECKCHPNLVATPALTETWSLILKLFSRTCDESPLMMELRSNFAGARRVRNSRNSQKQGPLWMVRGGAGIVAHVV